MKSLKTFALSATVALGTTVAAQAALIDFTDPSTYALSGSTGSGTSVDGSVSFKLAASGGTITNSEIADYSQDRVAPLKGSVDGLGIYGGKTDNRSRDEITFGNESLTISFERAVNISRLFFLDLFGTIPGGMATETDENVTVTSNTGQTANFRAQTLNQDGTVGFGDFATNLTGTSFTFIAGDENDAFSLPDFAMAGLDVSEIGVSEVPLPAGILLLGGALGGLGLARRKKKAA